VKKVSASMGDTNAHVPIFHFQEILNVRNQFVQCRTGEDNRVQWTTLFLFDVAPAGFRTIVMLLFLFEKQKYLSERTRRH